MMRASILLMVGYLVLFLTAVAVAQQTDYKPEERHEPKPMHEPDHLRDVEAQLVEELEQLHRKMEGIKPDSPGAEELKHHAHKLMEQLENVRQEMHHQEPGPQHPNPERHELERVLQKYKHELERLRRDHAGDPRIHELEQKVDHLRRELEGHSGTEPMHQPDRPPMNEPTGPTMHHTLKIFHLEHAPADHIAGIVEHFGGPGAVIVPEPRTNTIIVRAEAYIVDQIHEIIEHIDAPRSAVWQRLAEQEMEHELRMLKMKSKLKQHMAELEHSDWEHNVDYDGDEPTLHLTMRSGEEGLELFLQDAQVSVEELHERLRHVDVPDEWMLLLHVDGEVDEEFIHHMLETAEEMGFRKVKVEHRKQREMDHAEAEREMDHGEGHAEESEH